jgi:hypothetical protein
LRLVMQAGDAAPQGKGLFCLEQAVHDHGFPLVRETKKGTNRKRGHPEFSGSQMGSS